MVADYRGLWADLGLPSERFHATGQLPPADVPAALAAVDVAAMPHPWTTYFAYYLSPLKLFEYMAAGCALLATDLPSTREIVTDGETGLPAAPSDVDALAAALARLSADPALRARLGETAPAASLRALHLGCPRPGHHGIHHGSRLTGRVGRMVILGFGF